jgi:ankyrin repeat protein
MNAGSVAGVLAVLLLPGVLSAQSPPGTYSSANIRSAAAKAVVLLQEIGSTWYTKHTCTSCHHQSFPMMAFARARAHGVPVDEQKAAVHARRSSAYLRLDTGIQGAWQGSVANEEALALIALHETGIPPTVTAAAYARLIAGRQLPDGHWQSAGARPPQDYSEITVTARAVRTLQLFLPNRMARERAAQVARAKAWLEVQSPKATEELTYRLFGLAWAGASKRILKSAADALIRRQQSDGGWAQLPGLRTDTYSTAEALVALHESAGIPISHPVYRDGIRYLLNSQRDDGSWFVKSRILHPSAVSPPYFESGFPYYKDQYISCMATSWAVMALSLALPATATRDWPPGSSNGILADRAEPWEETILFGSATELGALLKNGFDPNRKNAHGTTALMMAIPDEQKVRLLLNAGAHVNTKADTRFTALMVATAYRGTTNIVRLLLDKGATVDPGDPLPVYHLSAGFLGVVAADTEALKFLLEKGADITRKAYTFGFFENDAFESAAFGGDRATVKYLAGRNRSATQLGAALMTSVISNRVGQVRDLLDLGANINEVDEHGMTPLLYAASVDFGSPDMIETLLKAHANISARTKDGATALALAKRYGYLDFQKALERAGATE